MIYFSAAKIIKLQTVKHIINCGVDVNRFNNHGDSPMHRASSNRNIECPFDVWKLMLDSGANPN